MKTFILQRMRHYVVYFKILPKVGRKFLKVRLYFIHCTETAASIVNLLVFLTWNPLHQALVSAWIGSTKLEKDEEDVAELEASDAVRVHSFLRVRDLVLAAPRHYMSDALKGWFHSALLHGGCICLADFFDTLYAVPPSPSQACISRL